MIPTDAGEVRGADAVLASRPTNTTSCPRSAIHASFVPNPAWTAGFDTDSGTCASSNWSAVRTSTTSAPARCFMLDLARSERMRVHAVSASAARG